MSDETKKLDVMKLLTSSSVIIGSLNELPGYNGSILTIDDEEAARIVRDLDSVRDAVAELIDTQRETLRMLGAAYLQLGMWTEGNKRIQRARELLARIGGDA